MMKTILTLAGAAAFAVASPAFATPDHAKGHGKHKNHGAAMMGYGAGGCPPGLSRKGKNCTPPGQTKKLYRVGQRYPGTYGSLWNYNQIPVDLRSQYNFDRGYRYYYGDGYLYQVDPRTRLIQQVVSAILN